MEITKKDIEDFQENLSLALVKMSQGKLDKEGADSLASSAVKKVDFSPDSALAHKGVNWYAKRILETIGIL
ncbi:hypothetical protein PRVXT_000233 [Proteinivorax tanatarense]|uniref:Uncharacterized protein n=1 Tax=Proteinivorax tanatarense TaxID=1260629 RepID=A0AAU7VM47_9FIRM